jgi:hypothetical protein
MDALEVQEEQSSLPLDKLAAIGIKIRDAKDKRTSDYKDNNALTLKVRWKCSKPRCWRLAKQ